MHANRELNLISNNCTGSMSIDHVWSAEAWKFQKHSLKGYRNPSVMNRTNHMCNTKEADLRNRYLSSAFWIYMEIMRAYVQRH